MAREAHTTEDKIRQHDEKAEHGFRAFLKKLFVPDYPGFVRYPYYPSIAVDVSDQSVKKIQTVDQQRSHYLEHYYEAYWRAPKLYHLIINTTLMSIEVTVKISSQWFARWKAKRNESSWCKD